MPAWQLNYCNRKVAALVEAWPVGIRAGYLRIVEMMQEHGPNLGMPHVSAMGGAKTETRALAAKDWLTPTGYHAGRA
jgi:hypothetical protein